MENRGDFPVQNRLFAKSVCHVARGTRGVALVLVSHVYARVCEIQSVPSVYRGIMRT
jgi:hypothetical protein